MEETNRGGRILEFNLAGRATFLKIYLDRILENLRLLKSRLGPRTEIIAVLKSNAYGHGSIPVARCLQAHGYNHAAVGTVQEGEELRQGGFNGFVQVFGSAVIEEMSSLHKNKLIPTVSEKTFLSEWADYNRKQGLKPGAVVIYIDTGLTLFGCLPRHLPDLVQSVLHAYLVKPSPSPMDWALAATRTVIFTSFSTSALVIPSNDVETCTDKDIPIHSLMTHFSHSPSGPVTAEGQMDLFMDTVQPYRDMGIKVQAANSCATLRNIGTDLDFVRPGAAMYGQMPGEFGLKPAIEWFARASLIKLCEDNQYVGYGNNYRCQSPETIAVIPIGYADGYSNLHSGNGFLTTYDGIKCPVVGDVSMDAVTVKVPKIAETFREFCVMAADFNEVNSLFAMEKKTGVGRIELLSNLSARLPRVYELSGNTSAYTRNNMN